MSNIPNNKRRGDQLTAEEWNNAAQVINELDAKAYLKPQQGIPKSDLHEGVQESLDNADNAYQKPDTGIPASDLASGVIPDISGFITKSVNDLTNYYLKSETYTKAEVASLIGAIQQFHYEIFPTLPQSGESNVLYLIGPTGTGKDKYEEYVYANGDFVPIGDTSINLSGYVTTSALNMALAEYTTTSDLTTLLNGKLNAPTTAGTSGQVLTSDGQGGQSWQTPTSGVSSYNDLNDKPQINSVTLSGNKTLSQLGIQSELTFDNAPTANSNNPVKSGGVKTALDAKQDSISDLSAIRNGAALGMTAYQKPSDGIPASDLASGVIPNSVVNVTSQQDGTVVLTMANGDTITIDLNHQHPNYYSKVAETTQPSGGMLPDVTYKLGTLTGATTFTFAAAVSGNLNHYYFTFASGSTAVVPTWPASITSWDGNCVDSTTGLPVIAASKTYEVSVLDGNAIIKEW